MLPARGPASLCVYCTPPIPYPILRDLAISHFPVFPLLHLFLCVLRIFVFSQVRSLVLFFQFTTNPL